MNPTRPPGPDLGTDVIQDRYVSLSRLAGQPQVEVGVVDEDQQVGAAGFEETVQAAQYPSNEWQVPYDLGDAHDGKPFDMVEQRASGPFHAVAADSKYIDSRPHCLERGHHAGAVHLSRCLTGDDHDSQ